MSHAKFHWIWLDYCVSFLLGTHPHLPVPTHSINHSEGSLTLVNGRIRQKRTVENVYPWTTLTAYTHTTYAHIFHCHSLKLITSFVKSAKFQYTECMWKQILYIAEHMHTIINIYQLSYIQTVSREKIYNCHCLHWVIFKFSPWVTNFHFHRKFHRQLHSMFHFLLHNFCYFIQVGLSYFIQELIMQLQH